MVKENQDDIFNEPIAIIGMNCQFPGVDCDVEDVDAFYDMLMKGNTPIKEVPPNRWDIDAYYDQDRKKADTIISRKGGFLNCLNLFDAGYFKISPTEAKQIDPQHRLFLEVAIRALLHANISLASLKDSNTGVYCGISTHEYSQLNYKDKIQFNAYTLIGAANSAAAGRLCHFLKLKGPCMAVDTACSSSLSALYLAVTALRMQQCPMAIVGGVHLNLCPENWIGLTKANMLSATGKCSSFDRRADGFARSEGCAVVIVKRLSDAIRDNDTIHAVIKSIVMNQDGDGASLASPNVNAQIALHQAALAQAKMNPNDIDYIETHGTGTPVGDAVEFEAIQMVHQGHHSQEKPLILAALKSMLGHTISSSGIASLIKAIGALKNASISPNLHYISPNLRIVPESIPAVFPVKTTPWRHDTSKKRVAQILNFGFSGTNVSAIIEEYPHAAKSLFPDESGPNCFVLSANSEYSLKQMIEKHLQYLRNSSASLRDICYTLINCRDHYKFRCAIIADDKTTLIKKMELGDYEIKKVVVNKVTTPGNNDAITFYDQYLTGANIQFDSKEYPYNKVDLPLYCFDRKPYWHTPRENQTPVHANINVEPIAIIGMSCRFPKAKDLDAFLALLQRGEDGMVDIPMDRWDNTKYYDEKIGTPGRLYIKQLGLIENIRNFDADFFDISPREAKLLSPNLRIFLETCYHAIENANLPFESIKGTNTGVFVGCERNEYPKLLKDEGMNLEDFDIYLATGNVMSAIPGRVAYAFNFHGPMQTVDTACSSSMTAIHNACLSLNAMDCDMAIAGGINLILIPDSNITLSNARMLSPESRCKTFSEDADGYARSEGCGVVVLKRLSRAIEDKDTILAVIKGSALNGDGKSDGLTVPNPKAQEAVIRQALVKAKLSPAEIDYIEAHGTGTPVADPIEANVLSQIFDESHSEEKPLYIGSVKTNIGHCESASGVASVIKVVLSLQHQTVFKHLHFKKLNPEIHFKHIQIPLNQLACKYPLRYAGINSFGFSGANAHLILEQAPCRQKEKTTQSSKEWLLMISAKKKTSLKLLLSSYQNYLLMTNDVFADLCYTAATCRQHFSYRVVIRARSAHEAAAMIADNQYTIHHVSKDKKSIESSLSLDQLQAAYQESYIVNTVDFYQSLDDVFEKVNLPLYEFDRATYSFNHQLTQKTEPALPAVVSPVRHDRARSWLNHYDDKTNEQKYQLCKNMVLGICRKVQEVSETETFEEDEGFFDIGFDSLMLMELSYELKDELDPWVNVTVNIGFDYPSINKLTNYIQEQLDIHYVAEPITEKLPMYSDDDIAIIGMSCVFPNAPDITAFEVLLEEGLSGIKDIPIERWDNSKYYSANREAPEKTYVNRMGLLEDIKAFDAQFFGISPREAKLMDPQQRLFLECCYHALENANYHPQSLRECVTGVFAGVSTNEYYARLEKSGFSDDTLNLYSITGNVLNLVSGRVAYAFDFKGPSISFDTACSSSLVAIHYACQSLKNREIDFALAGGVNVLLSPESNMKLCKANALSPDGQCKTFDETADGFVRSEGCGVIFLKRMSDALRDKDNVLAVIKASMVNNDGKSAGLTVPNGVSQEEVMRKALNQTGISIHDIAYVETHGTGTPLGDPIEVHAINRVYGNQRSPDKPLYIGSVKTNIGHLESASGVASVIKTVISLQKKKIYKHLNFSQLNPTIKLGDTRIALQNTDWKNGENQPKNAGINAFGFSGTNAHVILQEYVPERSQKTDRGVKKHWLVLSAKTKTALDRLVMRYQQYLETTQDDFGDICFTAATCRPHYSYRLALTAESAIQASHLLEIGQFALSHEKKLVHANEERFECDTLLDDYLNGGKVDWSLYYKPRVDGYIKVILPNYPFERSQFWLDEKNVVAHESVLQPVNEVGEIDDKNILQPVFPTEPHFLLSLQQQSKDERLKTLCHVLCEMTADILALDSIEKITAHDHLYSRGMDSLMFLELRYRIQDKLQCERLSLSIEYFINDPTIDNIARAIMDELNANTLPSAHLRGERDDGEVGLCDFQYIFGILHQLGYCTNVGMQLRLNGPLNKDFLCQAFDFVVHHNSVFWLNFRKDAPTQRIQRQGQFQLIENEMASQAGADAFTKEFKRNIMREIPLTQQPLVRVYLYKIEPLLHELHLVIPHIIIDDLSCSIVLSQFKACYAALCLGKKPVLTPEKETYLQYVQHNNTHYAQALPDKIAFWRQYNKGFKKLYLGAQYQLPDAAAPRTNHLFHYTIPKELMEAFIHWHQTKNRNISSGLIALCQMIFFKMSHQKKIPITILHSGREGSQFKPIVGLFSEYKRINISLNETDNLLDCIHSIDAQLLKTAPYQKCALPIKEEGLKGIGNSVSDYLTLMFNKRFLKNYFKQSQLHPLLRSYYLALYSHIVTLRNHMMIKDKLNQLLNWKLPLQKPVNVDVLISITPSFFDKQQEERRFADLEYTYCSHYASLDRSVGNQALWIYFTKNQEGEFQLSINGPLTKACKDQMAFDFNHLLSKLKNVETSSILDLLTENGMMLES